MLLDKITKVAKDLDKPNLNSSFSEKDCKLILNDIGNKVEEIDSELATRLYLLGVSHTNMLTSEYKLSEEYYEYFYDYLKKNTKRVAEYIAILSEKIIQSKSKDVILVSVAYTGTLTGVLIKRYVQLTYGINLHHYSISMLRDLGPDENAIVYIINKHQSANIQFIDSWLDNGYLIQSLKDFCLNFYKKYNVLLDSTFGVISDPSHFTKLYGTREDFLLPSSMVNHHSNGLISCTISRNDLVTPLGYHFAKYRKDLETNDLSYMIINSITIYFDYLNKCDIAIDEIEEKKHPSTSEIHYIKLEYNIRNKENIQVGINTATLLLMNMPPKYIIAKDLTDKSLEHILYLAKERNIPVYENKKLHYNCVSIIEREENLFLVNNRNLI